MNEIINKFLLTADKFVPELDLKQSGFTYHAKTQKFKNLEKHVI